MIYVMCLKSQTKPQSLEPQGFPGLCFGTGEGQVYISSLPSIYIPRIRFKGLGGMKKEKTEKTICFSDEHEKIELPEEIQRRMLDFFVQTSIPRKKAKNKTPSPEEKSAGEPS